MARADDHMPDDEAPASSASPDDDPGASLIDMDRLLRLRVVFALATLLIGLVFTLFASTVLALSLSGRLDLLFAAPASLLALGVLSLLLRAPLRAASAARPASDELRSAAGLSSLASGALLLAASLSFLALTFPVLLNAGGSSILILLPLVALTLASYSFVREATSDFLKKISTRRETLLFLTSLGHFMFLFFVFLVIAAASTASPVSLTSPPNGATICPGTPLHFSVNPSGIANITADNGSGPAPFLPPYQIHTTSWPEGPAALTINITDTQSARHSYRFSFNVSSASPTCA